MSDLSDLQAKAATNAHIRLEDGHDGNQVAVLGLDSSKNRSNYIIPIAVTFDNNGTAVFADVPRQSRSGSIVVDLRQAPKVKAALLGNAGRQGTDYLAKVGSDLGGNFTNDHQDSTFSLGASNPNPGTRMRLHGDVIVTIEGAAIAEGGPHTVGTSTAIFKHLALAAGLPNTAAKTSPGRTL